MMLGVSEDPICASASPIPYRHYDKQHLNNVKERQNDIINNTLRANTLIYDTIRNEFIKKIMKYVMNISAGVYINPAF